jgi:hypothetical protein
MKLFKSVLDFQRQEGWAYLIDNVADSRATRISIHELESITGLGVFPFLKEIF